MKRSHLIRALVAIVLLAVAGWVLYTRIRHVEVAEVAARMRQMAPERVLAACGLAVLNYLQLTLFDVLGLAYIGQRLPYPRVLLTSFVATAFGHNIGPSFASGGSVRYRFYSAWGLSANQVAVVVAFLAVTFLAGFSCVGGAMLVTIDKTLVLPVPVPVLRVIGAVLLLLAASYLTLSVVAGRVTPLKGKFRIPPPPIAFMQALVASVDWFMMAAIIDLLLPPGAIPYFTLLRVILVAQIAGMLSQVPAGIGVFESLMVTALTPALTASTVLGTLVVYRLVYFLGPFALAVVLFFATELVRRAARRERHARHAATSD